MFSVVVSIAAVAGVTGSGAAGAVSTPRTGRSLVSGALAAGAKAGSVDFVDRISSKQGTQNLTGEISPSTATEAVTRNGTTFEVELIRNVVYVKGPASVLQSALGVTSTQATLAAGKWISVTSTDSAFSSLTGALSLARTIDEFTPTGSRVRVRKAARLNGETVLPVVGAPSASVANGAEGTAVLYVAEKSPHLPAAASLILSKDGEELDENAVFTRWGTKVSFAAPVSVTPIASIVGG
jgi:hypothetical protein